MESRTINKNLRLSSITASNQSSERKLSTQEMCIGTRGGDVAVGSIPVLQGATEGCLGRVVTVVCSPLGGAQ